MKPTLAQMAAWFDELNGVVFAGELPQVKISFNSTRRQLGQFYWSNGRGVGIKISLFWDRTEYQFRSCLLHEMCHLYRYNRGWINERYGMRWRNIAAITDADWVPDFHGRTVVCPECELTPS